MRITGRLRASFLHSPIQRTKVIKLAKFAAHPGPRVTQRPDTGRTPTAQWPAPPVWALCGAKRQRLPPLAGRVPSYPFR